MLKKRLFEREGSALVDLWMDEGWFLVILLWVCFFWFLVPYYIFKWSYKYVYVPIDDRKEMQREQEAAKIRAAEIDRNLALIRERLQEAAPKSAVNSMRATILQDTTQLPSGATRYSVNMMLELSEAERAIVRSHSLEQIELENVPLHTERQIAESRHELQQEADQISAARQPYLKAVAREQVELVGNILKKERLVTTLGDLLIVPHQRLFETPHEANEYSNKLKTELLPKVKKLIDGYKDYKPAETIEL